MFQKNMVWDESLYQELINYLKKQSSGEKFINFSKKLITTRYPFIGIKVPTLRMIAKEISKTDITSFLDIVNQDSFEEVMLEGLVISNIKDFDISMSYFNNYIKKIDNWSLCDVICSSMKIISKNKDKSYIEIKKYLSSSNEFIVRVGIVLLLDYFICDDYIDKIFYIVDHIQRKEYYINMAIAWLVSVCFIKYKDKTYEYLKNNNLNKFTYNKSIQKIIESYRVSLEDKKILKNMKQCG